MIYLLFGIVRMIVAKLVFIRTIDTSYMCKLRNDIIQKKTLIIPNIGNCIGVIVKLNIVFTISVEKIKRKCYLI